MCLSPFFFFFFLQAGATDLDPRSAASWTTSTASPHLVCLPVPMRHRPCSTNTAGCRLSSLYRCAPAAAGPALDMITDRYMRPSLPLPPTGRPADDILRARIQTLGVAEHVFEMNLGRKSVTWRLYDVGLVSPCSGFSAGWWSASAVTGGGSQAPNMSSPQAGVSRDPVHDPRAWPGPMFLLNCLLTHHRLGVRGASDTPGFRSSTMPMRSSS